MSLLWGTTAASRNMGSSKERIWRVASRTSVLVGGTVEILGLVSFRQHKGTCHVPNASPS